MTTITQQIQAKPYIVTLCDHTYKAFAQAAVLVRQGYIFSPDSTPEIFPSTGMCNLVMTLGTPEDHTLSEVEAITAEAAELEQARYEREVEAAAKRMIETAAREAKQKQLDALRKEQEKALAKLQAELSK